MRGIYTLGIRLYSLAVRLASVRNDKARKFVQGRSNWKENLAKASNKLDKPVWVHCASLGEFEQGRPVIEKIKKDHPQKQVVLTFFSPSGYEIRKDYDLADLVLYLPVDTKGNAVEFLDLLKPCLAIFVKYEVWANYFLELKERNIPMFMISAVFRPDQRYFKWYGGIFRKALGAVTKFFVQNEQSIKLLKSIGFDNASIAGDTRFDRVADIAEHSVPVPMIDRFKGESPVIVAGSSWPQDETLLAKFIASWDRPLKLVIAPHEISESRLQSIEKLMPWDCLRYSKATMDDIHDAGILIIDNIGLLSRLYSHGDIAMIGGGFGRGIHNVLEAAVYGIPVVFGPKHQRFSEAVSLVNNGGALSVRTHSEFDELMSKWLLHPDERIEAGNNASRYVETQKGATELICSEIRGHL